MPVSASAPLTRRAPAVIGAIRPTVIRTLNPSQVRDLWTTSTYSYAPGGGGPGGGLVNEELVVGGWGDNYYTLLQFEIEDMPAAVDSVSLQLFCFKTRGVGTVSMALDRITTQWNWTTAGTGPDRERLWWADKPNAVNVRSLLPPCTTGSWYSIDITDIYRGWKSGANSNYGLQLRPLSSDNRWNEFHSSRYAVNPALRPRLALK